MSPPNDAAAVADSKKPRRVLIEQLTWPEIAAEIAAGSTTAIIPLGSSEQHGPHLPEGTDAMLAEAIAVRLAERLTDALVAPVIRPGCSDHHIAFAGTITITPDLMKALLDAYVDSLRRHGFERFVVFSAHGGNFPVLEDWSRDAPPEIIAFADLQAFVGAMLGALKAFGRNDNTLPHADACETAEMLLFHPELVRTARIERGYVGELNLETVLRGGIGAVSPNGILGDPRGATAEMGIAVLEAVVETLFRRVRRGAQFDRRNA